MADTDNAVREVPKNPRRLLIILHGLRAAQQDVRDAIKAARSSGIQVDVRVTWEEGDTARFIHSELGGDNRDMTRPPGVTVVAAGGDGTINECAAALLEIGMPKGVSLAVLPLGTSNDFAGTCNIPQDMEQALRLAADGKCIHPIDIGLLNGEVFMNTASLAAYSDLGPQTSNAAKAAMGPAAFLVGGVTSIASYSPVHSKLRYPAEPAGNKAKQHQGSKPGAGDNGDKTPGDVKVVGSNEETQDVAHNEPPGPEAAGVVPGHAAPSTDRTGDKKTPLLDKTSEKVSEESIGADKKGGAKNAEKAGKKAKGKDADKAETQVMEVEEDLLHMTVCNNRQVASMVQPCPNALLDDGMLDILYLVGRTSENVLGMVTDLLTNGLTGASVGDNAHFIRVPWLEIEGDEEMPATRDGEPIANNKKFRLEALKRKLLFHLPDNRMLLAGTDGDHVADLMPVATDEDHHHHHKHTLRDMIMRVTPFKKARAAGMLPPWLSPIVAVAKPFATVVVGFAVGYAVSRQNCAA